MTRIDQDTFRISLYAAVGVLVLALTGIFGSLSGRAVIAAEMLEVSLSTTLLLVALFGTGYLLAHRVRDHGIIAVLSNAVVGSVIVSVVLALLVVVVANATNIREATGINIQFIFPNLIDSFVEVMTFGQEETLQSGIVTLLMVSVGLGVLAGMSFVVPPAVRRVLLLSLGLTAIFGLTENQINDIITLPDAVALTAAFTFAYVTGMATRNVSIQERMGIGAISGALLIAGVSVVLFRVGVANEMALLTNTPPRILTYADSGIWQLIVWALACGMFGALGGLVTTAPDSAHDGAFYFFGSLLVIGLLNWQNGMNLLAAALILAQFIAMLGYLELTGNRKTQGTGDFSSLSQKNQRQVRRAVYAITLVVLVVAPMFLGRYITSVLDLMALYIIMGIGLNVMIGYAGLLDLGYVASFAIGAYTVGLLTTPSVVTCGFDLPVEVTPEFIEQSCRVLTFWTAWPLCVLVSATTGMLLGVPVLRLRGDYLAIVTLGFGEIVRLVVLSSDLAPIFGAAQGISPIPPPVVNLNWLNENWVFSLSGANTIYYLFLFSVILAALVVARLASTRIGRTWRAIRADEDVAQAMGIHLVRNKLLAFGISSAFAGLGGAIFGAWLQGIFPNSFTLLVSINVLSMIIIGGMGSIPGVVIGSLILIGMPELLRELQDYRLLAFGILLVVTMLLKPEGLLPPKPAPLTQMAQERRARQGVKV